MKSFFQEKTFCRIFNTICIPVFFLLFYYCLSITGENRADMDEFIYFKSDSILLNVFTICLSLFFLYFIGRLSGRLKTLRSRNLLLGCSCLLSAVMGFYWLFGSKTSPQADQMYLCQYASAFNHGDYTALERGGYIARYPQQLGMITLLRGIFILFGDMNYLPLHCLAAVCIPLMVLSGCQIVRYLSDNNVQAEVYYLLFILCCFPMYAYIPFVYGDLISAILCLFGTWMYLSCLKRFSFPRLILFGVSIGLGVQLRQNCLIFVIALTIVMLIKMLFHHTRRNLMMILALFAGCAVLQFALWGFYYDVRDKDASAIPPILYITMGLNDDYQRAGWHNQYEYNTFDAFDDNTALATEKGCEDLKMYFGIYQNDPDYMVDFFVRKMNSQWNAPMYQSLAANNHITGSQWPLAKEIYSYGKLTEAVEAGMKIFQLLLYGSILFLLILHRKEYVRIEQYLLLIAVFGGFLFSLLWEAKTRYVLPYLFLQIPYMAMGVNEIIVTIRRRQSRLA